MTPTPTSLDAQFFHRDLPSGVEFAADVLPYRQTVTLALRILSGVSDEPAELNGVAHICERTLSKGTQKYDGRALADMFDAMGARWSTVTGRQSTLVRVVCLPEFVLPVLDLVTELLCRPTFPPDAVDVALSLQQEELKHMEDDPHELLRRLSQRITLGDVLGRHPLGDAESLARISRAAVEQHWQRMYGAGRLQVAVAGPVDPEPLAREVDQRFAGFGRAERAGREAVDFAFTPQRAHQQKDLKQQYIAITLPGSARPSPLFPVEQVLLAVLSGGMSARLFTEVREKLGLVYWVAAWHEHPRGHGLIHLGASTTPERVQTTYDTLLRELKRLGEDLTDEEVLRARDGIVAQGETEDDLTRARAASLSDDLFHFSRPIGPAAKLDAIRAVTVAQVADYARTLRTDQLCVATVGPTTL